ncbi:MAG: Response regulator receiver domain protein [Candidatus Woesebacteria bacterium GW2011_GWA2_40_7]|uniref:Response regulator receiver domain protein n=3 Tax=Candidatus Woeseibacteriota TaxID=1752722 RepID=A0A0G0X774_9BACT|nr:MAG: Response regulator receiver domain protein [Candidatus Woesebacteria bacterium GW2011_GWB1_39_10]KKR73087.1 MAG: Response regulator receiver domain protein [Candidatus Woesebacteria bacterium GW2011_GWA2_40_7]KKR92510.1 MAG: Response regulator receiver domain protein [Candidatus Woesebacteria bacterium GW2011_GWA1_41_13b]
MKKILIVEDEPSFLNLLHKELTSKGYTVVDAKDGKEGYDTAMLVKPDLILLDILMPGVDGLTMLELLRKNRDGRDKVIILTNLELDNNVMKRALDAKPLYYFVKSDISLSALIQKIDEELMEQEVKELVEEDNEHRGII